MPYDLSWTFFLNRGVKENTPDQEAVECHVQSGSQVYREVEFQDKIGVYCGAPRNDATVRLKLIGSVRGWGCSGT